MIPIKDFLRGHAGLVAFCASAMAFGGLSVLKPGEPARGTPIMVPIVKNFVAAGSPVHSGDIRWVPESHLHPVKALNLKGYAKVPLFPGEILSPQNLGTLSKRSVLVAVAPTNGIDARVARVGSYVDVLVATAHGVSWQSGPLPVVSRSLGAGATASIDVSMEMRQAVVFEQWKSRGTVELVGMTS